MKVALYYPWIYLKSGVERTILETVGRSKNEFVIYTNHYDKEGTYPEFKKLNVIELKKVPVARNILSVIRSALIIIFQKIDLSNYKVLLVHSEGLGDLILCRNSSIPTICFCHTPLRPVFDNEYKIRARKQRSLFNNLAYRLLDHVFRFVDKKLWGKYKYIFFNSQESMRRAKEGALIPKSLKFEIIHPGIEWDNIKPNWRFEKYFFVPGRIMWTKNLELVIDSFKIFTNYPKNLGYKLIIAGQVDKKSQEYYKKLRDLSEKNANIVFDTNPTDKDMANLYKNCFAILATSFNEDWGITPLEANAFGKPVLAVNKGGFLESQIDGKTGFLIENDPNAFSSKMSYLAKNNKVVFRMGKNARINSKIYSWDNYIKILDNKLDEIYNNES